MKLPTPGAPRAVDLPTSYADLPFTEIRVTHVPESSPEVTPVVLLTLNRPKRYNAFTMHMMAELVHAYTLFDVDDRVKCIVQTGAGKAFCAGADLENKFVADEDTRDHRDGGGSVALAISRCRKPTIAAVNGAAVGVGITMTLPMNIRIAHADAKIGFVFARRGLVMEATSSFFLPRLIGTSKALHLCTTGGVYPASHRLLDSLFSETLPSADAVLPRALAIADEIVQNCSAVSTALMKELIYRNPGSPEATHLLDSRIVHELFQSPDFQEGAAAFLEKRPVKFAATMQSSAPAAWPWWEPVDVVPRTVPQGGQKGKAKL